MTNQINESGVGRPVLILHGGGGPFTVAGLAKHLGQTMHVITPTLPGWNGTERPEWMSGVDDLALHYLQLLEERNLTDVLLVGSSFGGWLGAEMAVRDGGHRITGLVLIDSGGVDVPGEPIAPIGNLTPRGLAELSFHDPDRFFVEPTVEQVAARRANGATMQVYAGNPYMHDPKLSRRLARVRIPTLVLWGESDRVITPAYGRALASAFGNARFELVPAAGHLPQIEQPAATCAAIDAFLAFPGATAGRAASALPLGSTASS